jgi:hypothetical protein
MFSNIILIPLIERVDIAVTPLAHNQKLLCLDLGREYPHRDFSRFFSGPSGNFHASDWIRVRLLAVRFLQFIIYI